MLINQCRSLYSNLNHVAIDLSRLKSFADNLKSDDLILPTWTEPWCINADPEKTLSWIFIFNCINFSYWSEPPWAAQVKGEIYGDNDPAIGVMASLASAMEFGTPLDDPKWLQQIDADDLKGLLYPAPGFGPLPLIEERVSALQELGSMFAHYGGAIGLLRSCKMSAPILTRFLNTQTEFWRDTVVYKDTEIPFAKRAWLVCGMIYARFLDDPSRNLTGHMEIPCFADYRLPQFLSGIGILRYDSILQESIINKEELSYGSIMETEIRIATIVATYELRQALLERFPRLNYMQIDAYLWNKAVSENDKLPPHHLVRGMAY